MGLFFEKSPGEVGNPLTQLDVGQAGGWGPFGQPPVIEAVVIGGRGDVEVRKGDGQAGGGVETLPLLKLEVEVGLGGVARVAALGDLLAPDHPLPHDHGDAPGAQVGQQRVFPAAVVQKDVVAPQVPGLADRGPLWRDGAVGLPG